MLYYKTIVIAIVKSKHNSNTKDIDLSEINKT